ncbi:VCBS repeat-containing protein [Chloroflexi bacterium TSY]|nr:VCBS repeat-containing protein [Chloroflexi bacterium TSY]
MHNQSIDISNAEPRSEQSPNVGVWVTAGFTAFRQGIFGSAGANLYVSRAGVLQRIHHFDLNQNGYVDLIFCNSQDHWERPPVYVYRNCLARGTRHELAAEGARAGVVADLNGDGYDDLVVGNYYNGIMLELNATIYFGSPQGWSEQFSQPLPAPLCSSVASGDFNGDGRPDLAFLCDGKVRLFYQSELGFEPQRYQKLAIEGEQLDAADLDGDGYADLLVRDVEGAVRVYWGAEDGLDIERSSLVPIPVDAPETSIHQDLTSDAEHVEDASPLVRALCLDDTTHIFVAHRQFAALVPVSLERTFDAPLLFRCAGAMAVAAGDLSGTSHEDLVFACRESDQPAANGERRQRSWIYWSDRGQYSEANRSSLSTFHACDVAVADLDGDGCAEVVICQNHDGVSYTTAALVFRGGRVGINNEPIQLASHDARRVLIGRSSDQPTPDVVLINHFARSKIGNIDNVIYFGGPDGYQPERCQRLPGWGAVEVLRVDLNDDGLPDLVFANAAENSIRRDPGSYIYLNSQSGFASQPSLSLPTTRAHGVVCADLNHNGYLDLVFCGFDNPELLFFYGSATGFDAANPTRLLMEHQGERFQEPRWIYLADLNNDGYLDLVVPQCASDRFFILWGGPDGFDMARCQFLSAIHVICARAADLTGNGYLDLIVGSLAPSPHGPHDSFVYIFWNGPAGLSSARCTVLPANHVNCIAVADFNNDGRLDLLSAPMPMAGCAIWIPISIGIVQDATFLLRIVHDSLPIRLRAVWLPILTMTAMLTWRLPITKCGAITWATLRSGGMGRRASTTAAPPACRPAVHTG